MAYAEALERRSKRPGRPNGCLGWVGLRVLKCLLWAFLGPRGCFPSYDRLQDETGLCRQSIRNAIRRLELAGVLKVVRRIVRVQVGGIVMTRQASNCYGFTPLETLAKGPSLPGRGDQPNTRKQKALRNEERIAAVRSEVFRGMIGDLVGAVLKRPTRTEPDWRDAARQMCRK